MAIYDKLQPMALHVGDIGGHPLGRYRAYEFPAVWAQALREDVFTPEDDEAGDEPRGLPLWAVTNAISTLMPQVLTNDARGLARTTWLAWNTVANGPAPVERRGDGVLAPHVYVSKNSTRYPWSYTLRLSAQTLPFDPSPRIHVHAASADGHAVPSSTPNAPSGYICYRLPPGRSHLTLRDRQYQVAQKLERHGRLSGLE